MEAGKDTRHREHLVKQLDKFRAALGNSSEVDTAEPKSEHDAAASPPAGPRSGTSGAAVSNAEPISLPRLEPPPPPLPE
jgi:hypothetical protein